MRRCTPPETAPASHRPTRSTGRVMAPVLQAGGRCDRRRTRRTHHSPAEPVPARPQRRAGQVFHPDRPQILPLQSERPSSREIPRSDPAPGQRFLPPAEKRTAFSVPSTAPRRSTGKEKGQEAHCGSWWRGSERRPSGRSIPAAPRQDQVEQGKHPPGPPAIGQLQPVSQAPLLRERPKHGRKALHSNHAAGSTANPESHPPSPLLPPSFQAAAG